MNIQKFNYETDILQAVIWQYNEATNLLGLLNYKQNWINVNQTEFWQDWYNYVFYLANPALGNIIDPNLQAMALFGLAVWSIILNVPLFVPITPPEVGVVWGFNFLDQQNGVLDGTTTVTGLSNTALLQIGNLVVDTGSPSYIPADTFIDTIVNGTTITLSAAATGSATHTLNFFENENLNFNNAPFAPSANLIVLTQPQQQFLLLVRYFDLVTRGALNAFNNMPAVINSASPLADIYLNNYPLGINQFFQYMCDTFGPLIGYSGQIYCYDNLNMTITYHFTTGDFPVALFNALTQLDLFPRPTGVAITT